MRQLRGTALKRFLRDSPDVAGELVLLLHDVEDPVNVGSAFRIADAAGVKKLLLTGITARPPHRLISKVGRKKDKRVAWQAYDELEEALAELESGGYRLSAVELTDESVPYDRFDYPKKLCLVVGHEDHGVVKKILERCHSSVYVPMYGKGASLNVHVALAVVTFQVLSHWRAAVASEVR